MHGLFLSLPAILLSPKRAMRQLCSLCSHNAQPLGTCRQPLNAVGRLILLFPKRCSCVKLCSLRGISTCRLWRLSAPSASGSHNCASRLGRAANRLTRLDVYSFPIHPVFAFSSLGNDINPAVYYIPAGWLR